MSLLITVLIGAAIGGVLGGLVGLLVRTSDKAWAFIKTPRRGAAVGAVAGVVFAIYFGGPSGWCNGKVLPLTAENFDATIARGKPVLVVFYRDGCQPCHQLAPRVERLADEFEGRLIVARVDAVAQGDLARRFGVRVVPTLVFFAAGQVAGAVEGGPSYDALSTRAEELIAQHAAATQQTALPESPAGKTDGEDTAHPPQEHPSE
jgi:thioredoxin 1